MRPKSVVRGQAVVVAAVAVVATAAAAAVVVALAVAAEAAVVVAVDAAAIAVIVATAATVAIAAAIGEFGLTHLQHQHLEVAGLGALQPDRVIRPGTAPMQDAQIAPRLCGRVAQHRFEALSGQRT